MDARLAVFRRSIPPEGARARKRDRERVCVCERDLAAFVDPRSPPLALRGHRAAAACGARTRVCCRSRTSTHARPRLSRLLALTRLSIGAELHPAGGDASGKGCGAHPRSPPPRLLPEGRDLAPRRAARGRGAPPTQVVPPLVHLRRRAAVPAGEEPVSFASRVAMSRGRSQRRGIGLQDARARRGVASSPLWESLTFEGFQHLAYGRARGGIDHRVLDPLADLLELVRQMLEIIRLPRLMRLRALVHKQRGGGGDIAVRARRVTRGRPRIGVPGVAPPR